MTHTAGWVTTTMGVSSGAGRSYTLFRQGVPSTVSWSWAEKKRQKTMFVCGATQKSKVKKKNIRSHRIHWNDIFCTLLEQVDNLKVQVRRNSAVFLCTALTSPPHFLSSLEAPTTAKWGYWKNACCFSWSCSESMTGSEEQSL